MFVESGIGTFKEMNTKVVTHVIILLMIKEFGNVSQLNNFGAFVPFRFF
jgi:hypothetical protein